MINKIDISKYPLKPSLIEAFEKIGQLAEQARKYDAIAQNALRDFSVPAVVSHVDKDEITRAISEFKPEPIISEEFLEQTRSYQEKSLVLLQSINENTANLQVMVELINQNVETQDELIALLIEVLSLAKAKDKEEADSLFKNIIKRLNDTAESVDSMVKIISWATAVYNAVNSMLN